jgi:hypothetical protein
MSEKKHPPPIEFERVGIDEARAALPGMLPRETFGRPKTPEELAAEEAELRARRARPEPSMNVIADDTLRWLARLPGEVRPEQLPRRFARIANQVAQRWSDREAASEFLNSLVFSDRPNRQGFPFEVARELAVLLTYRQDGTIPPPAGSLSIVKSDEG